MDKTQKPLMVEVEAGPVRLAGEPVDPDWPERWYGAKLYVQRGSTTNILANLLFSNS